VKKRWAVLAAAVVAAGAGVATVPAWGDTSGSGPQWMTCRDGRPPRVGHIHVSAIEDADPGERGEFWVKVDGRIRPCVKPRPDDTFAIVEFYGPRSEPGRYHSRSYDLYEAGGRFRDAIPLFDLTDLRAICLSSREGATARSSTRIDCVSVTWTEQDRERHRLPRVGRHISPRDPILQRPAKHYHDYRPGCVRCWE